MADIEHIRNSIIHNFILEYPGPVSLCLGHNIQNVPGDANT